MLSILFYFAFIMIYNSFCITCFGLQNPYWVLHHSMGTAEFWLVILVSCVLALLPRHVRFYLLFKLGYNHLNFMLHKPENFVKSSHLNVVLLFQKRFIELNEYQKEPCFFQSSQIMAANYLFIFVIFSRFY